MARSESHRAWEAALDRLEQEIELASRALRLAEPNPTPSTWTPPSLLGPMPMALVPRAQEIQRRQVELHHLLQEALIANRRHHDVTSRARQQPPAAPAYFDTSA